MERTSKKIWISKLMSKSNLTSISDQSVKLFFNQQEPQFKTKLLFLRNLIYEVANKLDEVDNLIESLKWGEPSYVPSKRMIGSPIRINRIKDTNQYAMFFNCQSNLVPTFKHIYSKTFNYGRNRSIIFDLTDKIPKKELSHCISLALTYHLIKKSIYPTNNKK